MNLQLKYFNRKLKNNTPLYFQSKHANKKNT